METHTTEERMASKNNETNPAGNSGRESDALHGRRSKWQESTSPRADDPVSPEEMQGHNLLGNSSLRDGAIPGVSDPARDGHGAPGERPDDLATGGTRKNPPQIEIGEELT
jgi:hypothetical protein